MSHTVKVIKSSHQVLSNCFLHSGKLPPVPAVKAKPLFSARLHAHGNQLWPTICCAQMQFKTEPYRMKKIKYVLRCSHCFDQPQSLRIFAQNMQLPSNYILLEGCETQIVYLLIIFKGTSATKDMDKMSTALTAQSQCIVGKIFLKMTHRQ